VKRCVLIVGLDRSGTSVTARVVDRLGVEMWNPQGEEHRHPTQNPTGYYEDPVINKALDEGRFGPVKRLIDKMRDKADWGLKDPRLSWPDNLQSVVNILRCFDPQREIWVIETVRDLDSILESRKRCGGLDKDRPVLEQIDRIKTRALERLEHTGEVARLLRADYDLLVDHPRDAVAKIAEWLHVKPTQKAVDAVVPHYRHFK
jgi:hypothetical protein